MRLVDSNFLTQYSGDDWIRDLLLKADASADLTMDRWLLDSLPKRAIFASLYGELLRAPRPQSLPRVLDVGGGVSSMTRQLSRNSSYVLLDLLAHNGLRYVRELEGKTNQPILCQQDWYDAIPDLPAFDLIIANDLFPNVDQRLTPFLERALLRSREVRVSLTFYDLPRYYMCKRVDAEEFMCMLAWNGAQTATVLKEFADRIVEADFSVFAAGQNSVFPNGRQVAIVTLRGMRE